jgi:hypothetical protein
MHYRSQQKEHVDMPNRGKRLQHPYAKSENNKKYNKNENGLDDGSIPTSIKIGGRLFCNRQAKGTVITVLLPLEV